MFLKGLNLKALNLLYFKGWIFLRLKLKVGADGYLLDPMYTELLPTCGSTDREYLQELA
jgi:hypothetical protein